MLSTTTNMTDNKLPRFVPPKNSRPLDVAVALVKFLLGEGARPVAEIQRLARRCHLSKGTVERARRQLGCVSYKHEGTWIVGIPRPIKEEA